MPHISPPICTSLLPFSSTPPPAIILFVWKHVRAIKWALSYVRPQDMFLG